MRKMIALLGILIIIMALPWRDQSFAEEEAVEIKDKRIQDGMRQIKANNWFGWVNKNGIPEVLEGNLYWGSKDGDKVEEAYKFLEQHKDLYQLEKPRGELKLRGGNRS